METHWHAKSFQNGEKKQTSNPCVLFCLFFFSMLFLSPGRSCFSPSNHMLIRSVSMFYSVLAAADDRRRPWADPATQTQTHTPNSLYYYTHSQDTQNHFGGAVKNDTQVQSREIHVSCQNGVGSVSIRICQFQKILSTNVKQFWMGVKKWCVCVVAICLVFEWSFRATLDTTSLCKRLAHTDAADTGL